MEIVGNCENSTNSTNYVESCKKLERGTKRSFSCKTVVIMGSTAQHFWDKECATAKLWQHIDADWYFVHDFKFIKRKYCDSKFLVCFPVNIAIPINEIIL